MIMKKFTFFTIVLSFLLFNSSFSQNLTVTYQFDKPQIVTNEEGYSTINMMDCFHFGDEGYPLLPLYGADLLLPQGTEIESVEILSSTYSEKIPNIIIEPASKMFPIIHGVADGYQVIPNEEIYNSDQAYPENIVTGIGTGYLAGHSIGSFSLCPLVFYPNQKQIQYLKEISLEIKTKNSQKASNASRFLKNSFSVSERINRIVENKELLKTYDYPDAKDLEVDILIITNNALLPSFDEYIAFKESTGFIVETITTDNLYSQYSGQDNQDKIRNCIIDYYESYNLEYVILGGDADPGSSTQNIIPHRGFHANDDSDIPADMYYCCLDGNWNDDGDNKWGEQGEYDLYAEVAIGRICADHALEVERFTHKLKMYQNEPVIADIEKALMVGEELNDNPLTFGGDYKDQIAYGSSAHGFTTAAISDNVDIYTLYDRDGGWSKWDVFDQFNNGGLNLLNHLGHSSPTYNMKMDNSDITTSNFQNDGVTRGFVIGYSQGCYNGSFDNRDWNYAYGEDCFAEKITTLTTAEVATVANSRYGWYSPGNTNSSSQYIDRQFYDAIFGEDMTIIGYTNSDSKEDNAAYFNDSYMRWTAYELNLFGDPSMDIWTAVPTDMVVNIAPSMPIGSSEINFETDAPFARIAILQNGELIGRAVADENGDGMVVFIEPVINPDPIEISIIAHNKNRFAGSMIVVSNQPYVLFESCQVNDPLGNGNGLIDFGEQISMGITVENVGDQPATNVVVNISSTCEYITITDNMENYGNMSAGESIFIDDAFAFEVADNIPNNNPIQFTVEAVGETTWESEFSLFACAPEFSFGQFLISDPLGNNNGMLDPGETVNLTFKIYNDGQSDAPATLAEISSLGNYVTINSQSYDLSTISAGSFKTAIFDVSIDANAPVGSFANLLVEVTSGSYYSSSDYLAKIGRILEDWESGNFESYDWETGGNAEWTINSVSPYEGNYCVKSGAVEDQQFSLLQLDYNVMSDDSISFYVKVSSEADYDYLKFYIDGEVVGQWAGNFGWERVSFAISEGTHLLKWLYIKDTYVSSGSDCAWVDFIELPTALTTTAFAGQDEITCASDDFDFICAGTATNYNAVEWTTSGTGSFDDASLINPVYSPSYDDVSSGSVILTLTVYGADETVSDDMVLTINQSPEIVMNGNVETCAGSDYMVSDISAQNYNQITWSTSGDGTFDDMHILEATYTPGENDIINGEVTLTLLADANEPCESVSEDIQITIFPLPVVELGNDTSVCHYHTIILDAGNSGSDYLWSTGETTQTIEASSEGVIDVLTFSVEVMEPTGCMGTDEIMISFEECAGISDTYQNGKLSISPNPSNGIFNLNLQLEKSDKIDVLIINSMNLTVYSTRNIQGIEFNDQIDLSNLSKGVYYLHVSGQYTFLSRKIVIQ